MSAPMKTKKLISAKLCTFSPKESDKSCNLAISNDDWSRLFKHEEENSITVALLRDPVGKCNQSSGGVSFSGHAPFPSLSVPVPLAPARSTCTDDDGSLELGQDPSVGSHSECANFNDIRESIRLCHPSCAQFAILQKRNDVDSQGCEKASKTKSSSQHVKGNDDKLPKVYCTGRFLSHYQFSPNSLILFRPVTTFPLSKVTLGAKSSAAYSWAEKNKFSVGLVISVCKDKVLCRKGDTFLPPGADLFEDSNDKILEDFMVLDCEPVMQGHLTVNTSLIITNLSKTFDVERLPRQKSVLDNITSPPSTITKSLLFSDFLGSLRKPEVFTSRSKSLIDEEPSVFLTPVVDSSMLQLQSCPRKNDCLSFDLVLLPKTLLARMGLFHESLVLVNIAAVDSPGIPGVDDSDGSETDIANRQRVARVNYAPDDCDDNTIYLSPSMWFNLLDIPCILDPGQNTIKIKVQKFSGIELDGADDPVYTPSTSLSWCSGLPIAEEVQLALVCSPNYGASINMEKALKTFFTVERLICLGDVLAINKGSTDICDGDTFMPLQFGVVYFKVIKIAPNCSQCLTYVANVNCTTLYQMGVEHSYIPAMMDPFFRSDPSMDYWNQFTPPGLRDYTNQLSEMIMPYLFNRSMTDHLTPSLLLIGPHGVGKTTAVSAVAQSFGVHLVKVNCHDLCGESSAASEARIKNALVKAESYTPCILLLQNVQALGKERDGLSEDARVTSTFHGLLKKTTNQLEFPLIVIGTAPSVKNIDTTMSDGFLHELHMMTPVEEERLAMLEGLLSDRIFGADVNLSHVAQRSAGMMLGDLVALVTCVKRRACQRLKPMLSPNFTPGEEEDLCLAGFSLLQTDFDVALDKLQAVHSDAIGAPKIPNITWDDVGGLAKIKSEILDTIQLPLQHPELLVAGLRRSGVCLFGPPGTGKTLLAKAVATECSLNFLSVKGPELINMYVGQSEENVREVFSRARRASPCVIFFDELDSLAPNRGMSGDSGGVMDRVVSQLLAELDGLVKSCDVFVIGATNRPDLLDPALLRPGRFDKLLYVGISEDKESQLKVLQALTRKMCLSKDCNLECVVDRCPPNMTGADFYALCSDAMLCAIKKQVSLQEQGKTEAGKKLFVEEEDFYSALSTLQPSVSLEELESFKQIHANLQQRE